MRSEDKVRLRIRESKSKLRKLLLNALSGRHDLRRSLFKISIILYRFHTHDLRRQVHSVGVEGKFHIIQIVDQLFITDAETDTHSRHGSGLGKSLHHQKVFVFFKQWQSTLTAEVHISLIHDHYHIGIRLQDLFDHFQRFLYTGRCVGVREDHTAVWLLVILGINVPVLIQGTGTIRDPVQIRPYIVKGICHIREQDRFSAVKKGQECHG